MRFEWSVPNCLTALRMGLTPFVVANILSNDCSAALGLILVAGLSDGADGFLARRFDWQTALGAWLDPIADKLLLVSVYLSLAVTLVAPRWLVALIISRDLFILGMVVSGLLLTKIREFPPTVWGKMTTLAQIATALLLLASCAWPIGEGWVLPAAVIVTASLTVWSGLDYAWRGWRMLRAARGWR